jgi:tetratricopeptide (TPR) repeat protein
VQSIFSGALKDFGAAQRDRIRRRRALGASDLLGALEALRGKHRERVVLITDAVATAGETQSVVSKAGELGLDIGRIDVLLSGGLRDDTLAAAMARDLATGRGVVADLQQSAGELARKLTRATVDVRANVEGAAWYFPKSFDGMQPGDARLLYVAYPKAGPKPSKVDVEMTVSGKRQSRSYAVLPAQGPLLERAAASAKIGELSLMLQRGSAGAAERHRIVELSTSYRVLSDLTAMLVLESDADYQRYGLARNSLSDILVVGATGVELVQRTDLVYQPFEVVSPEPLRPGVRRDDKPAIAPQPVPLAEAKKEKKDASSTLTFPPTRNSARERRALNKPSAPEPQSPAQLDIQAAEETQSALEGGEWAEASEADGYGYEFEEDPLARASQGAGRAAQPAPPPPPPAAAPAPEPPPAAAAEDFEMPAPEPQSAPSDAVLRAESATAARQRVGRPGASSPDVAAAEVAIDEASEATVARADAWRTDGPAAHTGKYRDVIELTRSGQLGVAVERGFAWVDSEPGDALALLALGEALEGQGHLGSAARAYGSLIDLFPARSDLRRFAATRLERLGKAGLSLAVDSYDKAREQRPDHLTGYRLQAYALVRLGRYEEALSLLLEAVTKPSRIQRAALASEVLARDISLVAAAYAKAEPKRRAAIAQRIAPITKIASEPSTSFVLSWETDTNDVDLHVVDRDGDHAYYGNRRLRSGGELLEDVTRGYGPELFAIGGKLPAAPYELGVHYYSRGPMGYGMGRVEVIEHDGRGGLMLQTRPFVIMNDDARISLGTFTPTRP